MEQGADVSGPIPILLGLFFPNATRIKKSAIYSPNLVSWPDFVPKKERII